MSGKPKLLYLDDAAEFTSDAAIRASLAALAQVKVIYAPPFELEQEGARPCRL